MKEHRFCLQSLRQVFADSEPYLLPFKETLPTRSLLAGISAGHLSRWQFSALRRAAAKIGDEKCFYSRLDDTWYWESTAFNPAEELECIRFSLASFDKYRDIPFGYSEVLWPPSAQWGMLISHDDVIFVGGSAPFVDCLVQLWPRAPDAPTDPGELLAIYARFFVQVTEIPEEERVFQILAHVLGARKARDAFDRRHDG